MIAAVVKLMLVTTLLLLLPCALTQDECRGLDVFPPEIDDLVAKTQACNAVEVMKSVEASARCAATQVFGFGTPRQLFNAQGGTSQILCDMINQVLAIGIPIPVDLCNQVNDDIVAPLVSGKMGKIDVESFVTPILESVIESTIKSAKTSVDTFSGFIDSFNVCLPVNVNPNYWRAKMEKIIELFKTIKDGTDHGTRMMQDLTAMGDCRVYTVVFTVDIDALAIFGKQVGLYFTFNMKKGIVVEDMGTVSSVVASYNINPDLDVSIGTTVAIVMGAMADEEWGYAVELGASIPVYGVGVGVSAALLFTADPDTKALGNFNGISMSLSAKLGESSASVDVDASVSCAYSTAKSFTGSFNQSEQDACGNVGRNRIKTAIAELRESAEEAWDIIQGKVDQLESCGRLYACEAKRCVYNFNKDNYDDCKDMANKCADDMKECGKWAHKCEKKTTVKEKGSCKAHTCRKVKEKTSCKTRKCSETCKKIKNKCGPFNFACNAFSKVCKTTCNGACIAWNYATKTVCDGACKSWNWVKKEVVDTLVTAGDCAAKGMKKVAEKVKCLKYLPKCAGTPFCYSSKATVGALKCTSGMIAPSEECLRKHGFL